jgi:riboflavin biosynthesis pyrimidine reductase
MSKLRLEITMSLDGFVAGKNQSQQNPLGYLAAGLIDEMEIHVLPVLLGEGARLFDNLDGSAAKLEQVRAVEAPDLTHLVK